jgi:hypothetical protein
MYRKNLILYIGLGTICDFGHTLGIWKHIHLADKGYTLLVNMAYSHLHLKILLKYRNLLKHIVLFKSFGHAVITSYDTAFLSVLLKFKDLQTM